MVSMHAIIRRQMIPLIKRTIVYDIVIIRQLSSPNCLAFKTLHLVASWEAKQKYDTGIPKILPPLATIYSERSA